MTFFYYKDKYLYALSIFILLFLNIPEAKSFQSCDTVRSCTGNALHITVTSGKGAQYVDVPMSKSISDMKSAMTVEMWIKPEAQAGKKQFIAGIWGPGEDVNDVWTIYISPDDSLVFELNGQNTELRDLDNTIVKAYAGNLYKTWNSIAAVFDGSKQTAYIYINGSLIDSARNYLYPLSQLRKPQDNLPLQIGSTNALSNNNNNRTILGWIDEVRIWNKVIPSFELYCGMNQSLNDKVDNLILYYRFNQTPVNFDICDASEFGNHGQARSGARCESGNRPIQIKFISNISSITDTLVCDTLKSWTFSITDTSICGGRVWMRVIDDLSTSYTITPTNMYLLPNQPNQFTLTLNTNFVGNINSRLQIISYDRCGSYITVPIKLKRITELEYSKSIIDFDTVVAGCKDKPYIDSTFTICNNTAQFGSPRVVTVNSITTGFPGTYQIISRPMPFQIMPGDCETITVRFTRGYLTKVYNTNITINTDDICNPKATIQLKGAAFEALNVTTNGKTRLDSINFGTFCINVASPGVRYYWNNQMNTQISVDTILIPEHFIGMPLKFPINLNPKWGYNPNYFRFLPTKQGFFRDSIIFIVRTDECVVERKLYVTGTGFYADLSFEAPTLDFGSVIVGQQSALNAKITNNSSDTMRVNFYLRKGVAFSLNVITSATILPGNSVSIPVTFNPLQNEDYTDELCYYETKCGTSGCVQLNGKGIIQRLNFIPMVMETKNVVGCGSELDTLWIENVSGQTQTLDNFTFTNPGGRYSLVEPPAMPNSLIIQNGNSEKFVFRYTPNDVITEHADKAFLEFRTSDGQRWNAKLFGTSIIPKIFVTEFTKYGTLEVGDVRRDTLLMENISPFPVRVDSIDIPNGFTLIYPNRIINQSLNNGDSIRIILDFTPLAPGTYKGDVVVHSSAPCEVIGSGIVQGESVIVPLEIPISVISFGFVRPCDCVVRELPLINNSQAFEMSIDSLWIDDIGLTNGFPEFFSWTSFYSPGGTTPYSIPKSKFDTVKIKFCPRTPAQREFVDMSANINVKASGSGWERKYTTFLVGKRSLVIQPTPDTIGFPPTRVDTLSVTQYDNIIIPDYNVNPDRADVTLDSISFMPDERVFYAADSLGRLFPITIDSTENISIKLDFKPRAVRKYEAKMVLHFSNPCYFSDTTVFVSSEGFAPAYGLNLNFDNLKISPDTFKVINCQTIDIPVYSSRDIPAKVINVHSMFLYDTTKLEYIGSTSPYLSAPCDPFVPSINVYDIDETGKEIVAKNLCWVDSTRPIFIASFRPRNLDRDTIKIKIDSIHFDTEDVILYHLIADGDEATIVVQKPEISIINQITFDSVQVLDCNTDTLLVVNTGDVPASVDNLLQLPDYTVIESSVPPMNTLLNVGDTIAIVLKFCPRKKDSFDNILISESIDPCFVYDSASISGTGFAPPFEVISDISDNFTAMDTVRTILGDTVQLPVYLSKDFAANIKGSLYWLEALRFDVQMSYNPYPLKFISAESRIDGNFNFTSKPGNLTLHYQNVDTLRAGPIAMITFLTTVPDSIISSISIEASGFDTDSILFLDIIPIGSPAVLEVEGKCSITFMKFSDEQTSLMQNVPNPWSDRTTIEFSINEYAPVVLEVYDMTGKLRLKALDGSRVFPPGKYKVEINAADLESGTYFYNIEAGVFKSTKPMVIIK